MLKKLDNQGRWRFFGRLPLDLYMLGRRSFGQKCMYILIRYPGFKALNSSDVVSRVEPLHALLVPPSRCCKPVFLRPRLAILAFDESDLKTFPSVHDPRFIGHAIVVSQSISLPRFETWLPVHQTSHV